MVIAVTHGVVLEHVLTREGRVGVERVGGRGGQLLVGEGAQRGLGDEGVERHGRRIEGRRLAFGGAGARGQPAAESGAVAA